MNNATLLALGATVLCGTLAVAGAHSYASGRAQRRALVDRLAGSQGGPARTASGRVRRFTAVELGVPFLGRIPIYEPIRIGGDTGVPIAIGEPDSAAARAFRGTAERLAAQLSIASYSRRAIALTPVS